jgi:Gp37 protein
MLILALEGAIVTQLQAALPDVQVLPFPNDPAELGRVVNAKQIYVGFKRKQLTAPDSSLIGGRVPVQKCNLEYELILRMQELRSHQITYPVMEKIEQSLIGFRPDIGTTNDLLTTAFYGTDSGFVDFGAGLWLYSMSFAIGAVFTSKTQPSWGKPISY